MPLAPAIATQLTDHGSHPWGLFVAGVDVIGMAPIEDREVIEAGPGGVSSMTFTVTDLDKTFSIVDGAEVQYWDLATPKLEFRGYVDSWTAEPVVQGRKFKVSCIGVEAWLDWIVVPSFNPGSASGSNGVDMVGRLIQQYAPMLRAPTVSATASMANPPYTRAGSFDYPIGSMIRPTEPSSVVSRPGLGTYVFPGGTLRANIEDCLANCAWFDVTASDWGAFEGVKFLLTVDFHMGVRLWEDAPDVEPDDYAFMAITDTLPSVAGVSESLSFDHEPGDIPREVYIAGGNAAGSGLFGDGTGIRGRQAYISDSSILTADDAASLAANYLAGQSEQIRGSLARSDFTPDPDVHAGSRIRVTDVPTGADSGGRDGDDFYRIYEIRKTYNKSGRQNWTVAFGGLPRSGARLMRKLTREVLS